MQPTNPSKTDNQIIDKAIWVAKECLSPRASQYDESASFPIENWSDLWKHGLLSISVPKAYGGLELDMPTYILVIENLAKGCTLSSNNSLTSWQQRTRRNSSTRKWWTTESCSQAGAVSPDEDPVLKK
jgi:alkylation response protein AidB-like acyl-CoA dehydrogenase